MTKIDYWEKAAVLQFSRTRAQGATIEDAQQDISGAVVDGATTPRQALRQLRRRPFGYSSPEAIEREVDESYRQYATTLASLTDDEYARRVVELCLIEACRLPSRGELVAVGMAEKSARALQANIRAASAAVLLDIGSQSQPETPEPTWEERLAEFAECITVSKFSIAKRCARLRQPPTPALPPAPAPALKLVGAGDVVAKRDDIRLARLNRAFSRRRERDKVACAVAMEIAKLGLLWLL